MSALSISGGGGWVGPQGDGHGQDAQGYGGVQQMQRQVGMQQQQQGGSGGGFNPGQFVAMASPDDAQHASFAQQAGGRGSGTETDEDLFAMYVFKVVHCSKQFVHDWKECPYAHEGETARRRHPNQHTAQPCPNFKSTKMCPRWPPLPPIFPAATGFFAV